MRVLIRYSQKLTRPIREPDLRTGFFWKRGVLRSLPPHRSSRDCSPVFHRTELPNIVNLWDSRRTAGEHANWANIWLFTLEGVAIFPTDLSEPVLTWQKPTHTILSFKQWFDSSSTPICAPRSVTSSTGAALATHFLEAGQVDRDSCHRLKYGESICIIKPTMRVFAWASSLFDTP